jgi:hypothetical protein
MITTFRRSTYMSIQTFYSNALIHMHSQAIWIKEEEWCTDGDGEEQNKIAEIWAKVLI